MTEFIAGPYDVVVVGARPAGAATAMLLARAGLRVLVVDRGRYGDDTVSTHALLRGGVVQLARWGLLDQVASAGTPPVRSSVFHYGNDGLEVPIKPGHGFDALYAPRRTVLDPILVDAARRAGAEVRFGVTVAGLQRDRDRRITGVVGRDHHGEPFAATAQLTVGADGIGSPVARFAGAPVNQAAVHAAAFVYGYWTGLPVRSYELYYRPGITGGAFPTNHGQTCVFVGVPPQRLRRQLRAGAQPAYHRLLGEVAPELVAGSGAARPPQQLRMFARRRPGYLRQAAGPGWALVGDAGYFKDPITAHGITDALRDAELLARAIIDVVAGGAPEADTLAGYQATRDRLSQRLFDITDAIASFAWDLDRIPSLLVQLSEAMADEVTWLTALDPLGTTV